MTRCRSDDGTEELVARGAPKMTVYRKSCERVSLSRDIKKYDYREWRRTERRETCLQQQKEMVRRTISCEEVQYPTAAPRGGWRARRLELFRMLEGGATVGSENKSC